MMLAKILGILVLITSFFFLPIPVGLAVIQSCTYTTSSQSSTNHTFTITNSNPDPSFANYISISRASSDFAIVGNSALSGWNSSYTADTVTYTNGSLAESQSVSVTVQTNTTPSGWGVSLSDSNGNSTTACSQSSSPVPVISAITVTNVTSSSVTVTWTTDILSDSAVSFGLTDSYGMTLSDSATTTDHAMTLVNLIPNTTYHFRVESANSNGTAQSTDDTFTTAYCKKKLKDQGKQKC